MTSARDTEQQWSFAGIKFPAESWENHGGIRDHVHEYWKSEGGDPEKGGRKLYEFTVTANFQDRFRRYPDLYPNQLDKLLRLWEQQTTSDLVIPFRGTIKCYAVEWTEKGSAKVRSGEIVTIKFREDGPQQFTIEVTDSAPKSIGRGASSLAAVLDRASIPEGDTNLFDQIQTLANSITSIADTSALYGQLVGAKVEQLASLCDQADRLKSMQTAASSPVIEALHDLWASCVQIANDVQGRRTKLQVWTVTMTMPMSSVSVAIYGDTSHQDELLSLNTGTVRDPLRVIAGTQLAFYPPS